MDTFEIYWDNLTEETQKKLLKLLGDNGNYDVFPLATIYLDDIEEKQPWRRNNHENSIHL